jgi:hypothetical protein
MESVSSPSAERDRRLKEYSRIVEKGAKAFSVLVPIKNVVVLAFKKQWDLAMSFVRMQAFYNDLAFKGRTFSLEEFMDRYVAVHGTFDYHTRRVVYHLPGSAHWDWGMKFKSLLPCGVRDRELSLRHPFVAMGREEISKYYIVGISVEGYCGEDPFYRHGLAHALYHVSPAYRRQADRLLEEWKGLDIHPYGAAMNLSRDVMDDDERQACLASGTSDWSSLSTPFCVDTPPDPTFKKLLDRHLRAKSTEIAKQISEI